MDEEVLFGDRWISLVMMVNSNGGDFDMENVDRFTMKDRDIFAVE